MCRILGSWVLLALAPLGFAQEVNDSGQVQGDQVPQSSAHLVLDTGGHSAQPLALVFTPDGKTLISSSEDRTVQVWDVPTGERLRVFRPPLGSDGGGSKPHDLAVDRQGERVVFWVEVKDDNGKKIRTTFVCSLATGQMQAIKLGGKPVFTPDGKSLAMMEGHNLHLVEIATGVKLKTAKLLATKSEKVVVHGAFSPDGGTLAAVAEDERLFLLDPATLKVRQTWTVRGASDLRSVNWANDKTLVCRTKAVDKALVIVDANTGKLLKSFTLQVVLSQVPKADDMQFVGAHAITGTTKVFLRTHSAPDLRTEACYVLDWASGEMTKAFKLTNPYGCKAGAIAPDLSVAAQGNSDDNDIILWNPRTGKEFKKGGQTRSLRAAVHGAKGWWWSIRWRPDGKALVYEKMPDAGGGFAEFDLTKLKLQGLKPAKFDEYGEKNANLVLGGKKPSAYAAEQKMHERGLLFRWEGRSFSWPLPDLKIRGGPEPVVVKDVNGVKWDYSFVAGGRRVATEAYYSRVLQIYDSATGKRLFRTPVVHSFIQALAVSPKPDCRYILIGSSDQTLTVYNPMTGKVILTVFPAGRDWIAWTPQGYYAATPGGQRLTGWHVDNGPDQPASFFPADRFPALYRPDVIKWVFEKGNVQEALVAANAALPSALRPKSNAVVDVASILPPKTILQLVAKGTQGMVKLRTDVEPGVGTQPIKSMRLMVDGRPLAGSGYLQEFGNAPPKGSVPWPDLPLPPGRHHVVVLVRTADASSVSNILEIDTLPAKDRPTLHVLAIGISKYKDKGLDLACAANDARLIAQTFSQCKGAIFGNVRATVLVDDKATRAALIDAIVRLRTDPVNKVKDGDLVVLFFGGHGAKEKEEFYLLAHDAVLDSLATTALTGAKLQEELKALPCQVLLMLDACQSAAYGAKGKLAQKDLPPATDLATRKMTEDEVAVAVMCAAMGNEKAIERDQNGLFTKAVAAALTAKGGVPCNPVNHKQYLHHLQSYVFDRVTAESDDRQHPFLHLPWVVESFALRQVPDITTK